MNDNIEEKLPIKRFLSRHIPDQVGTTRKLCYRHRPDLIKKRLPESNDIKSAQRVNI
jgi:F-box/WD-40 domain protein MET30